MVSNYLPLPHAPLPSITYPFWRLLGRLEKFVLSVLNINSSGVFCLSTPPPPPPPPPGGVLCLYTPPPPPRPSPVDGINWELIDGFCLTNIDILNNWKRKMCYGDGLGGGEGDSWEFFVGFCLPIFQILTLFQTKKCHFPHSFSDQTTKIHTRFAVYILSNDDIISA